MNALDRLRAELERPPYNRWLAPRPIVVDEDRKEIVIALPYRPEFSYHPTQDVFHGGVIAALADIAGYASIAIWSDAPTPTVTLQVDYLAQAAGPELLVKAMVRRFGRSLSRVDVEISANDRLVALARGTFSTRGKST